VFGSEFRDSGGYLILLLPGTILSSAVDALSVFYQNALGRPGLPLLYSAANAVSTVCLCLLLIPALGTSGAAVSSAAGSAIAFVIALGLMFRARPSSS
jgi:O-antigen/teichoic acid export membrane protein